jgi:hypothetical protein
MEQTVYCSTIKRTNPDFVGPNPLVATILDGIMNLQYVIGLVRQVEKPADFG